MQINNASKHNHGLNDLVQSIEAFAQEPNPCKITGHEVQSAIILKATREHVTRIKNYTNHKENQY